MTIVNDIISNHADVSFAEKDFTKLYIELREKENRIYTDEQVEQLPLIEPSHDHYHEWQIRKRSADRLINYLRNKNKPLSILEVGCGNGWLSAMLSTIEGSTITGEDINKAELDQARRIFGKKTNIDFVEGDIRYIDWGDKKFDTIIFAASIQYFSSFEKTMRDVMSLLNDDGEIHIIDSHFYKPNEKEKARLRSLSYFRCAGYEDMNEFYYHHTIDSLNFFDYKFLFDPSAFKNKLFRKKDQFPWVCIVAR